MTSVPDVPARGQTRLDYWAGLHAAVVDDAVRLRYQLATDGWSPDDIDRIVDDYRAWICSIVDAAHAEAWVVANRDELGGAA